MRDIIIWICPQHGIILFVMDPNIAYQEKKFYAMIIPLPRVSCKLLVPHL